MTGQNQDPSEVVIAAESAILDGAVGLAREWRPDVQGNWEEDEFRLPAEEYLRLMSCSELRRLMSHLGEPQLVLSRPVLTVVAPNRLGLLSQVAGTLALHALTVRSAAIASGEGAMAVAVIELESDEQHLADWDHVRFDLLLVLAGQLCLDTKLAQLAANTTTCLPAAAGATDTRIFIDNITSATTTLVEVRAHNDLGLLYRITKALAQAGLDVSTAQVSAVDGKAVDSFYVTDTTGAKICDAIAIRNLECAILNEVCHTQRI